MSSVKIKDDLYKEISEFCKLNSFTVFEYVNEKLKIAINDDKYGNIPFGVIEKNVAQKQQIGNIIVAQEQQNDNIEQFFDESRQESRQTVQIAEEDEIIKTNEKEVKPKKRRL